MRYSFPLPPMGKPRMTKADKWKKRPVVLKYWNWCDALRGFASKARFSLPDHGAHVTFHFPMPPSWSQKMKEKMRGEPHRTKPDADNVLKGFMDALNKKDETVWNITVTKLWADDGFIEVEI